MAVSNRTHRGRVYERMGCFRRPSSQVAVGGRNIKGAPCGVRFECFSLNRSRGGTPFMTSNIKYVWDGCAQAKHFDRELLLRPSPFSICEHRSNGPRVRFRRVHNPLADGFRAG